MAKPESDKSRSGGFCRKAGYKSKAIAKRAMRHMHTSAKPNRAYHCPWCSEWHLTSKPRIDELHEREVAKVAAMRETC